MGIKPAIISGQLTPRRSANSQLLIKYDQNETKLEMSEGKLSAVWDSCIADAVVKTGTGAALGSLVSLVLFKRKLWPITFGLGTGFGIGCSNCQHMVQQPNMIHMSKLHKIPAS